MAAETVDVIVRGKDEASKALKDVSESIGGIEKAAGKSTGGGAAFALSGIGAAATAAAGVAVLAIGTITAGLFDISKQASDARTALQGLDGVNLDGVLKDASLLSARYGVDTQETVAATRALMDEFGITSDEATSLLIAGFEKGLNTSDDFLDSIGEYSNLFAENGASAEEFFSLLETGQANGVLGTDKAADAFKEFGIRLMDGSKASSDALATLFGSFVDNTEDIEASQKSVAKLEAQLARLSSAKTQDPAKIAAVREELERERIILNGLTAAQGEFAAGASNAFGGGIEELMQALSEGTIKAADALPLVQQALSNIEDPIQRNQLGVALFGTQWEDLGASAVLSMDLAATSMEELNTSADEGRSRFASLGEIGPRLWGEFTTALLPASDKLLELANDIAPSVLGAMEPLGAWLAKAVDWFNGLISGISGAGTEGGILSTIITTAQPILTSFGQWVQDVAAWFMSDLLPALTSAGQGFLTMLQPHIERLGEILVNDVYPILRDVGEFLMANIPAAIGIVAPIITGLVDVTLSGLELALKAIATTWETYLKPAFQAIGQWLATMTGGWDNLTRGATRLKNSLSDVARMIRSVIDGALKAPSWLVNGLGAVGEKVAGLVPGLAGGTSNFGGGLALVGERGPELVNLPRGSGVTPAAQTRDMLSGGGGGVANVALTVNVGSVDSSERASEIARMAAQEAAAALSKAIDGLILGAGAR